MKQEMQRIHKPEINNLKSNVRGRAYFHWVTREQGSFGWFKGVMDDVAESDHNVSPPFKLFSCLVFLTLPFLLRGLLMNDKFEYFAAHYRNAQLLD